MKPLLAAIAISTGLLLSPAIANEPEIPPRSIKVDSDDSASSPTANAENATHLENAMEQQRMAKPLEEMPKELERRYKKK